jgi:hypothetical protein
MAMEQREEKHENTIFIQSEKRWQECSQKEKKLEGGILI